MKISKLLKMCNVKETMWMIREDVRSRVGDSIIIPCAGQFYVTPKRKLFRSIRNFGAVYNIIHMVGNNMQLKFVRII